MREKYRQKYYLQNYSLQESQEFTAWMALENISKQGWLKSIVKFFVVVASLMAMLYQVRPGNYIVL